MFDKTEDNIVISILDISSTVIETVTYAQRQLLSDNNRISTKLRTKMIRDMVELAEPSTLLRIPHVSFHISNVGEIPGPGSDISILYQKDLAINSGKDDIIITGSFYDFLRIFRNVFSAGSDVSHRIRKVMQICYELLYGHYPIIFGISGKAETPWRPWSISLPPALGGTTINPDKIEEMMDVLSKSGGFCPVAGELCPCEKYCTEEVCDSKLFIKEDSNDEERDLIITG